MNRSYDAVVVGGGPNGLAAAIVCASAGLSTVVLEAADAPGGGARTEALTLPGFHHDVCSSVHPMARASPFFRSLPLERFGLDWITPPAAAAHPLDGGDAVVLHNDLERTAAQLGPDGERYRRAIGSVVRRWSRIEEALLGPLGIPAHPLDYAAFGIPALLPATWFSRRFSTVTARALFAGCAAHSIIPLTSVGSTAIGLALAAVGHVHGWPIPRGGSGAMATALTGYLESLGGEIVTGTLVEHHSQLPRSRIVLFDTAPRSVARILGDRLSARRARSLTRYRYGPGAFKVDWALREPIPWKAKVCLTSATVHVGGTLEEIAASERAPWKGECADRPFVLVAQPSLFDPTRAPAGHHTAWAYCHVPNGSPVDMTERIERQIERFAPGFKDVILARVSRSPAMMERENPNLVGGDVGGGANDVLNLLFRPTWRNYSIGMPGAYLCSAATPPGGGVHGMCGYHAAVRAIKRELGRAGTAALRIGPDKTADLPGTADLEIGR